MIIMLWQRIEARSGTSEYGRLSVMTQQSCTAQTCFNVPASVFVPPPKVTGTMVRIEPRVTPLAPAPVTELEVVCRQVFGQRRKMLSNAITYAAPPPRHTTRQRSTNGLPPHDTRHTTHTTHDHCVSTLGEGSLPLIARAGLDPTKRPDALTVPAFSFLLSLSFFFFRSFFLSFWQLTSVYTTGTRSKSGAASPGPTRSGWTK
jgi:16S rRNA A1518/A1519 N6-dimethyltransferase RsmA/KsgA/DIM1 with predicted DNA glycosylase/AP lyase activity